MRARQRHLNQRDAGGVLVLDSRRISGLSDGNAISQWDDASRSGWNATQTTGALQPLYKTEIQGGQPIVRFDGAGTTATGDRLINSSVSAAQTFSCLAVFQLSSADTNGAVIFDSFSNVPCSLYTGTGVDNPNNFALGAGSTQPSVASRNNNWNIAACQFSGATSFGSFNGTKTTVSFSPGSNSLTGISIGTLRGNPTPVLANYSFNGDMGLIAIISTALADPLRKRLEHAAAFSFKIACN
jgi:hypothetical protein